MVIEKSSSSSMEVNEDDEQSPRVRILTIPRFSETGELVLLDAETLEVEIVKFGTWQNVKKGES